MERAGKYLFVKRTNTQWMAGYYGLPSGKVEKGEGFLAAAVREAKEEVGVTILPEDVECVHVLWRDERAQQQDMEWCDLLFSAKKWSGRPYNAEPDVHGEIAWFSLDQLPSNVVPSVLAMLQKYQEGLPYSEYRTEIEK